MALASSFVFNVLTVLRSHRPPPSSTLFISSLSQLFFRSSPSTVSTFALQSMFSPVWPAEVPPEGYRRSVGICLISPSKKIFTASRLDMPVIWQMPQGDIEEGEDPRSAAIRKLREETGVTSAEVLSEVPLWFIYDFPPELRERSDWKGEAQKWFLLKLTGNEDEINLLTEKPKFGRWLWASSAEVIANTDDVMKLVYREVLSLFGPYLY